MLRFFIPIILIIISDKRTVVGQSVFSKQQTTISAASTSQIKNAQENNYDDTGPGAKEPEFAYKTYKTYEDALVAFLDDPDTKLPDNEKNIALSKLNVRQLQKKETLDLKPVPIPRQYPKTVEEYTGYKKPEEEVKYQYVFPQKYLQDQNKDVNYNYDFNLIPKPIKSWKGSELFRAHRVKPIKGSPLSLAHYTRDPIDFASNYYRPSPSYDLSYEVHDKDAVEPRPVHGVHPSSVLRGYYSFKDADGKQRVVHYR